MKGHSLPGVKQRKPVTKKPKTDPIKKKSDKNSKNLTKYVLICSKLKCKYKKTIMKKELSEKDRICPRCKSEMKVK